MSKFDPFINYPEPGAIYEHYKGGTYEFLYMAKHSENEEPVCVYKSVLFGSYHVRPLSSWDETVDVKNIVNGRLIRKVARFKYKNNL